MAARQAQHAIVAYDSFRAQLAELKTSNASLVFDYQDTKGNKEARSYIYKLRQTRTAVDKVREAEKAESLKHGRMVDAEAKAIMEEITTMIDIHQKPLDDIERKEKERTDALVAKIQWLSGAGVVLATASTEELEAKLAEVNAFIVDASYQEFMAQATDAKNITIQALSAALESARTRAKEKIELERLRKETADREQREREARLVQEAEQRAKDAAAGAIRQANEAREKAERDAKDTEERLRRETADAKAKETKETEKREANKKHCAKINNEAKDGLMAGGLPEEHAKLAITLIAKGAIPRVSIAY